MELPRLLLVDDSASMLALAHAALAGKYAVTTATDGVAALEAMARARPDVVVMDLNMPRMDGDEVLARAQEDAALASVPIVIVSTDRERGEACLALGARAFVPKPIDAATLRRAVDRALEEARVHTPDGALPILPLAVGDVALAVPLCRVTQVLLQVATRPLLVGSVLVAEVIEHREATIPVLDLGRRFGVAHKAPIEQRKLVLTRRDDRALALSADEVWDPEVIAAADVSRGDVIAAGRLPLLAFARTPRGGLPVVDPLALLSRARWTSIRDAVARGAA